MAATSLWSKRCEVENQEAKTKTRDAETFNSPKQYQLQDNGFHYVVE